MGDGDIMGGIEGWQDQGMAALSDGMIEIGDGGMEGWRGWRDGQMDHFDVSL